MKRIIAGVWKDVVGALQTKGILVSLLVLLSLSAILATACSVPVTAVGNGAVIDKQYSFEDFTGVEISSGIKYEITQGNYYNVVGAGSQNLIDRMDISQSGQTLFVTVERGSYRLSEFKVTITMPELKRLTLEGACIGNVTGFDSLKDFALIVDGASRANLAGSTEKANLHVTGASRVDGSAFQIHDADISVDGLSSATIEVTGVLDATVDGVSTLNYTGNPTLGTIHVDGISRIVRK